MRRALAILAVLSVHHLHLLGQASAALSIGQSVRVTSRQQEVTAEVGQVLSATSDTIVIQLRGVRTVNYRQVFRTDTLVLPLATIDRLEVSRHTGHRTGRGALIGLGVGATAGFVFGAASYKPCAPESFCWEPASAAAAGMEGAAILGLIGAGVGALIGSTIRADQWEAVALRTASVRVLPRHDVGLGVTIAF